MCFKGMGTSLNLILKMGNFDIYSMKSKIEIPKTFKTFISEEYFQNCISCNKYLL
jgi:formate hydrogenlyase subunit 6/NADH:ubiquinone oxidoreductase subunit I